MRPHFCDLLQCRSVHKNGVQTLEKWRCEHCLSMTPECKTYEDKRKRRNLSESGKTLARQARHARKLQYRLLKRNQIRKERYQSRQNVERQRALRRNSKKSRINR